MTAIEMVEKLARALQTELIVMFLKQCEEKGYSLHEAIAELQLIAEKL